MTSAARNQAANISRQGRRPRSGAKRTVMSVITMLPNYLKLLYGLLRDGRVQALDKMLVVGAIAYILLPLDFIPDWIPFLGEVDDVFVLMTALERLMANAGRSVLLQHWDGHPSELSAARLGQIVSAAAFFLPSRMRARLRKKALTGVRGLPKRVRKMRDRYL